MRIRSTLAFLSLIALTRGSVYGQASFEVASVRPSAPDSEDTQRSWGQGSGQVVLRGVTLYYIVREAFGLHDFQISAPKWMEEERYDILATAPAGTAHPVILQMLQTLVQERFQMTSHTEVEEAAIYALTRRQDGPEPKDVSRQASEPQDVSIANNPTGQARFTMSDPVFGTYHFTPVRLGIQYEFDGITMLGLERMLNRSYLDRPVLDRTGLGGAYAVTLDVPFPSSLTGNSDPLGYSVEESLKKHGLQLNRERGVVNKLVIDRISKEPTAN